MSPRISQIALAGMILALIFAIGANVISLLSQKAFMVPGSARPNQMSMTAALDTMAAEETLRPGAEAAIAMTEVPSTSALRRGPSSIPRFSRRQLGQRYWRCLA